MSQEAEGAGQPLGRLLVQAVQRHQTGDPAAALTLYQEILARAPDHPDALNMGGVAAYQSGNVALGLALLRRAVAVAPDVAEARNNLGNLLQETGELDEARAAFEAAIARKPGFVQAHANLGNVLMLVGDTAAAVEAYGRALALAPENPELHHDLGTALTAAGQLEAAAASYRRAIQLHPTYAKAFNNLAAVLQKTGQLEEALEACRRAVVLAPDYAKGHFNLGCLLQALRRNSEAIEAYRRALALAPGHGEAHYNLGLVLQAVGDLEAARVAYRDALAADPAQTSARHMLDALSGRTTDIAPPSHIQQMFDNYARGFESHLVEVLGYSAPEALEQVVARQAGASRPAFDRMLDLGCGTGLVARRFRACTARIEGVDLAPKMVAMARESGLYDAVHQATLEDFFAERRGQPPAYDLVTSADVFIYIGRLDPVFCGVAEALRAGGLFAFSLERLDDGDFRLRPSGRYAQSEGYIRALADAFGFRALAFSPFVLRKEYDTEIDGLACLLARAD